MKCPECNSDCTLHKEQNVRPCHKTYTLSKAKKHRYCNSRLPAWKILLFASAFIKKDWTHRAVDPSLALSKWSSINWRSFCSGITKEWYRNKQPIGAIGVIVEIDETTDQAERLCRTRPQTDLVVHGYQKDLQMLLCVLISWQET